MTLAIIDVMVLYTHRRFLNIFTYEPYCIQDIYNKRGNFRVGVIFAELAATKWTVYSTFIKINKYALIKNILKHTGPNL